MRNDCVSISGLEKINACGSLQSVSRSVMEQRANIKFCFKIGKTASETYELLKIAYGDAAMSRSRTFEWYARFRDGRESTEDDQRCGRPTTKRTENEVAKVRALVAADRRMTVRMLADELNMGKDTVHKILTEDLGKRKICSRFVPHFLTDDQKQCRMEACGELIDSADRDPLFLQSIVTGDESWCYQYDPETKRQSAEWRSPSSPRQKKFRFQKSKVKVMLIAFFDAHGLIHHEFVPPNETVNKEYYEAVLHRLVKRVKRVRPNMVDKGSWFLLHYNARPHCALNVRRFLAKHDIVQVNHPPYSPDLSPPDFYLFPKLKISLKGHRFQDIEDIKKNVTAQLRSISSEDYETCFQNLYSRAQKCVSAGGDYFEDY